MGALLRLLVATESFPPRPHPLDPNLSLMIPASLPQLLLTRHSGSLERSGEWGWGEVGGLGRELLAVCPFQKLLGRWGHTGVLTGLKLSLRETMRGRSGWQGLPHASALKLCLILAIPASPAQKKKKKGHFPYRGLTGMCRVFNPAFGELSS